MRALFLGLLVLSVAGCEACTDPVAVPEDGDCVIDADCDADELCQGGRCRPDPDVTGCDENADCGVDEVCRAGACVPPADSGTCASSGDCDRTQRCTTEDDVCLVSEECARAEPGAGCDEACYGDCVDRAACDVDADCGITEDCEDGVCIPMGDCDVDADCVFDAFCADGVCTQTGDCDVDTDCPATQACNEGRCVQNPTCVDDAGCPPSQRCVAGVCTRRDPCTTDDECAFDETCVDGTCAVIGTCETVNDCPNEPGIACLDNVCTRAPCGRDSDCDNGAFCDGVETCNPRVGCADGPDPATPGLPSCASETCDEDNNTLIVVANNDRCVDGSPCTDDVCDTGLGCVFPENTFVPNPGPLGDCVKTVCSGGELLTVADNTELPSDPGPANDCKRAVCQSAARQLVNDDSEVPAQGPDNDCRQQICRNGTVATVSDDDEVPPQGPNNDCDREICQGGLVFTVDANDEVPPQGPPNDCVREICNGGRATTTPADAETPPQTSTTDCKRDVCSGGAVAQVANDVETPAQLANNDCTSQVCSGGVVSNTPNNGETPPQRAVNDCTTQSCNGGVVVDVANNAEVPPQASATDCKRQVCSGGAVATQNNDAETPADVGCKDGTCVNGTPTTVENDGNCSDTLVCTVGSCNVDGTCTQTPQDNLCSCSAGQTGICRLADARDTNNDGCICLTPAAAPVCSVDDGDLDKRVLERFELNATPAVFAAGTTFTWELVGTPAGVDPAAQLLGNATNRTTAFFQPTAPSATAGAPPAPVRDYLLRMTMQEPDLPPQSCQVAVSAEKIPDTLEVTLFMNDPLDVDIHVVGGVSASQFDFPFHTSHNPAAPFNDNPNLNCYWDNCAVCTVNIPGQGCTAISPRVVDFDNPADGAALADPQDPQLDIDNQRGCFTGANGDLQCIPEKITVVEPDAGTYFVFPYLWGNALALNPGLASTPSSTTVTVELKCRGVTQTFTRTLSSIAAGGGVAAANDPARYATTPAQIIVPTTGPCSITLP
jgi:hypothetical protein